MALTMATQVDRDEAEITRLRACNLACVHLRNWAP